MFIPPGYHTVTPYMLVDGAAPLIEFLAAAFDAQELQRSLRPDGEIANAQLRIGDSMLMISEAVDDWPARPASYYLYVDDADRSVSRALEAGAELVMAVADMSYGDRQGGVRDPSGNLWWVSQHLHDEPYADD